MENILNKFAKIIMLVIIVLQCDNAMCQTETHQPNNEDDYTLDSKQKSTYYKTPAEEMEDNKVYTEVDKKPEYPGGYPALYKFIADHLKYPEAAKMKGIQGKVFVRFVVGKEGDVEEPEVVKSDNPVLNSEAIRVVKNLPKWIPGSHKGKNVRVSNTIPVNFKFNEQMIANEAPQAPKSDDEVYLNVEKMPVYSCGDLELRKFIAGNVKYPEEAKAQKIQGTVFVQFIIDKNGDVVNPQIAMSADPLLNAEAIRVVKSMSKWEPGTQRGKPVSVWMVVPVDFELPTRQTFPK